MAGNVKGITIEFRGDTSKLSKALTTVRKEARDFDKELGYIDNSLKFNPGNVELTKQKMTVLRQAADKAEENVKDLKQALDKMKSEGVDETSADYRELEREIIRAESKQKAYNKELKKMEAASSKLGKLSESFKTFGSKAEAAGQALMPLSAAGAAVDAAIGALAYTSGKAADDLNTMSKQTGVSTADLQKYKAAADLVDVSVETMANSQVILKKRMYQAEQGSKKQAKAFDTLGVSITDSNGELRSQSEVFDEVIAALGNMENETERDALAMQIFGGNATELNSLIKDGGKTYKQVAQIYKDNNLAIIDQETLDNANRFNDAIDTIKLTASAALSQVGTTLAATLAPALEKAVEWVGKLAEWFSNLSPTTMTVITVIAGVVAAIGPLLIIVGKVATGISAIMSLVSTIGPALAGLAGPIGIVIAIVGALIAIGVLLYKNWDKIKAKAKEVKDWVVNKWTELKTSVSNIFNNIKTTITNIWNNIKESVKRVAVEITVWTLKKFMEIRDKVKNIFTTIKNTASTIWKGIKTAITHPIETAFDLIKKIVEKIKGLFSNLSIKLPHIKTPHFSIQPPGWKLGDLLKGTIPKLGIEWYKKGGIFNSPSVIGVGEAGPEAVLPIDKLKTWMQDMNGGVTINVYGSPGMDVNELAAAVERRLVNSVKQRKYAWG